MLVKILSKKRTKSLTMRTLTAFLLLFVVNIITATTTKPVFAGNDGYVPEGVASFFDMFVPLFAAILSLLEAATNAVISLVTGIFNNWGFVGIIVLVVALILAFFALRFVWRFIKLLCRKIKKLFFKITGLEEKRRQKLDKYRKETMAKKQEYDDLLKFHNEEKKQPISTNYWEDEIAKVVDKIIAAGKMDTTIDSTAWEEMIAGTAPYDEKITEIEKKIFAIEDKIHSLVAQIASLQKQQIVVEMARLRIEFKVLNKNLDYLKQLQEAFPEDTDITSLIELSNAFMQATKGVEKGFVVALSK
ncbi:MAG: hypothetical protein FWG68_11800 [Defluviitaleaceae bacterium]|nr:hypothetical protein [Defluviitaleaceae bacterium]